MHVDLEDDGVAFAEDAADLALERAVAVAVDMGPLEELAGLDAAAELLIRKEVIVDAIDLPLPGAPRGGRNRQAQARNPLPQLCDQRALAYA